MAFSQCFNFSFKIGCSADSWGHAFLFIFRVANYLTLGVANGLRSFDLDMKLWVESRLKGWKFITPNKCDYFLCKGQKWQCQTFLLGAFPQKKTTTNCVVEKEDCHKAMHVLIIVCLDGRQIGLVSLKQTETDISFASCHMLKPVEIVLCIVVFVCRQIL